MLIAIAIIIRLSLPSEPADIGNNLLDDYAGTISLILGSLTIAGIAFLWFMGVARDLLGHLEDQFLSTVSLGSGLIFLVLIFIWAAIGGALLDSYSRDAGVLIGSGTYSVGRALMAQIAGIYAMRMAGVYVFSSGTIWLRTGVMPRWLAIITWGTALVLWLAGGLFWWAQLVFPAWVLLVSVYILITNRRDEPRSGNQEHHLDLMEP